MKTTVLFLIACLAFVSCTRRPVQKDAPINRVPMDHSMMDHSKVDHAKMDHSKMAGKMAGMNCAKMPCCADKAGNKAGDKAAAPEHKH